MKASLKPQNPPKLALEGTGQNADRAFSPGASALQELEIAIYEATALLSLLSLVHVSSRRDDSRDLDNPNPAKSYAIDGISVLETEVRAKLTEAFEKVHDAFSTAGQGRATA